MSVIARILEKWDSPSVLGPCSCSQLRRTARKVTSLYDDALASCGLTVTQHAILVSVARAGNLSRTALAAKLGMEPATTLIRNLKPLEKQKLIVAAASDDKRERQMKLSAEGRRQLRQSYDLWERAQEAFNAELQPHEMERLRTALTRAEAAAEAVLMRGRQG